MSGARLCVALDLAQREEALSLAEAVAPHVDVLKVGLTLFAGAGPAAVSDLARLRPVFLDLKLHDIPAQVAGAVASAATSGASLLTVHASGGRAMLKEAVGAAGEDLTLLAVTVLTSLDDGDLAELGIDGTSTDGVLRLSELALDCGVPGLVCSPLEVGPLRERFGARAEGGPLLVIPGIRPGGAGGDDQRRTLGPAEAVEAGADILVVGRPITAAPDPASAAASFKAAMSR